MFHSDDWGHERRQGLGGRVRGAVGVSLLLVAACTSSGLPRIDVFHGSEQKVGHLGDAQSDFNLMGHVSNARDVQQFVYSLNGGPPRPLVIGLAKDGFGDGRRLASNGDFNADIPVSSLEPGTNRVTLTLTTVDDEVVETTVTISHYSGRSPLPVKINWREVSDPQDVGQYVDGEWALGPEGLSTVQSGYDRLFLLGESTWQDYEISTSLKVHDVTSKTGPRSGANGVGVIMRFAGHVVGGHRGFAAAQPKYGYQPFGAIAWLRWTSGSRRLPTREYYRGDRDLGLDFGRMDFQAEVWYRIKVRGETLPDPSAGTGLTRYSFKIWPEGEPEPSGWDWQEVQESEHALRRGGVALVAHHVHVTFGNITIAPL